MATTKGYQYQFVDSIPEDHRCRQCSLVARKLTITSCCGESYCDSCIHSLQQAKKACLGCKEEKFETFQHAKLQKKILSLQVYCPLKEKGCEWCGRLEQLDVHLDPDKGDCEYADVHCPLKCEYMITRMNVEHHVSNECMKRDFICPYCSLKGTYEMIFAEHWPKCSYYPLCCRNHCGVTCERQTMDYHMKICPLEKVDCKFKDYGCIATFKREDEEEHMKANVQMHLTIATESFKIKLEAQEKQQEQLLKQLLEQEKSFEKKLLEQQRKFEEQLMKQELKFEKMLGLRDLKQTRPKYEFVMEKFSELKRKQRFSDWMSPAMYIHNIYEYKFCIGIDIQGYGISKRKTMIIRLWFMRGKFDAILKWPVKARFTLELINHGNSKWNQKATTTTTWNKPGGEYLRSDDQTGRFSARCSDYFIHHNDISSYLKNDALHFILTDVCVLH